MNEEAYYKKMEKVWEGAYYPTLELKEIEQFYTECGYTMTIDEIIKRFMDQIESKEALKILDFGCDTGLMLNYFRQYSNQFYGTDINKKAIETGKKQFPEFFLHQSHGLTIDFDDDFFDVIFISAVLKHIRYEDRSALYAELKRVGKHFIIVEKNSEKPFEEKYEGFTFYNSNFVTELEEHFKPVDVFEMGGDCCGLYEAE
jgi:ubiquinone/menaquinone biosynthesis C-methylase UbiE